MLRANHCLGGYKKMNEQKNQQISSNLKDLTENSDLMRKKSFVNIIIYILIATLIIFILLIIFDLVLEVKYQDLAGHSIANYEKCIKYWRSFNKIDNVISVCIYLLIFLNIILLFFGIILGIFSNLSKKMNIKKSKIALISILSVINLFIMFFVYLMIIFKAQTAWCITT